MGVLACSLVALMLAGGGQGTKYMETTVQDDALFLHRPAASVQKSARKLVELGADRVRLTAGWSDIAPEPFRRKVPAAPFDASDSQTYPKHAWDNLDKAVRAANSEGLGIQIDLAFWAPRWAVGAPSKNRARQRIYPSAGAFADFALAAARRYSGGYRDPQDGDKTLPAVRMWTTWNEPNHPSFLAPQWTPDGKGSYRPMSPHIYRAMHNAAYDAIKKVSAANKVLVGGTAATGSTVPGKGAVPPLQFLRTFACVDEALEPLKVPECENYKPVKADGWAHHPYSRTVTPGTVGETADDAMIAGTDRLGALLDELFSRKRFSQRLGVFHTEYGYESKEDDPFQPFSRDQQAAFIGWSTYLAWRDPHTRMFAQFLLQDIDPAESGRKPGTRQYFRDWQTGLYAADGKPKPAAQAFKLPFWAQTEGTGDDKAVMLFGAVRPGKGQQVVHVEKRNPDTGAWEAVQTFGPTCDATAPEFLTDHGGFFRRAAPALGAATYRFAWRRDDKHTEYSVPIDVAAEGVTPERGGLRLVPPAPGS
jgi:hypothetical protein